MASKFQKYIYKANILEAPVLNIQARFMNTGKTIFHQHDTGKKERHFLHT